jgi:hypothetical protein
MPIMLREIGFSDNGYDSRFTDRESSHLLFPRYGLELELPFFDFLRRRLEMVG